MPQARTTPTEIQYWWHGMPALPADRTDHQYFALRRIWADHTMAGVRGFYRLPSEDHITPRLFQNWIIAPDNRWLESLGHKIGLELHNVRQVRWAYACEEFVPDNRRNYHKREFVIADIMLFFEDASGPGVIAFEVKRPGTQVTAEDGVKLGTYVELGKLGGNDRSYGCLLVSAQLANRAAEICERKWPVLTWEQLGDVQMQAAGRMTSSSGSLHYLQGWLAWQFQTCGAPLASVSPVPQPLVAEYGSPEEYRAIEGMALPAAAERFVKGASCAQAISEGVSAAPPLPWLADEPNMPTIRERRWQTTQDRRIRRWGMDWRVTRERAW